MKTFTIEGFELIEICGDGQTTKSEGIVSDPQVALKWVNRSPNWRELREYKKTYRICESMEELEGMKHREKLRVILNMMKEHEIDVLKTYGLRIPEGGL